MLVPSLLLTIYTDHSEFHVTLQNHWQLSPLWPSPSQAPIGHVLTQHPKTELTAGSVIHPRHRS